VQLSDPSALYEVAVFSEVLNQHRHNLEPGCAIALTVEAKKDGEQLRIQVQGVQPIDDAVADAAATSLKVFIADPGAFSSIHARLSRSDVPRGGSYDLSPRVRAALKDAPGVIEVIEV